MYCVYTCQPIVTRYKRRWQDCARQKAVLEGIDTEFDELARERTGEKTSHPNGEK
jgi:hypothetical protein